MISTQLYDPCRSFMLCTAGGRLDSKVVVVVAVCSWSSCSWSWSWSSCSCWESRFSSNNSSFTETGGRVSAPRIINPPCRICSRALWLGTPSTRAKYRLLIFGILVITVSSSLSWSFFLNNDGSGSQIRLVKAPSVVKSNRPSESRSNRPHVCQLQLIVLVVDVAVILACSSGGGTVSTAAAAAAAAADKNGRFKDERVDRTVRCLRCAHSRSLLKLHNVKAGLYKAI